MMCLSIFSFSRTATPASIRMGGGVESKFDLGWGVVDRPGEGVVPEVRGRFEHVHRGDLEGDRLELGQQVQVHEVLLDSDEGS